MKKNYIHIGIILDASGSMARISDDIKGTINTFMAEQKKEEGKTVFDVFQFSDEVSRIVEKADVASYSGKLMENYHCCGCTALNDAVCIAIDTLGKEFADMPEEERPEHVIMVIVTDGYENASREYELKDVKDRIDRQTKEYNWEFVYLAANQSEFEAGNISRSMGVHQSRVAENMAVFGETTRRELCQTVRNYRERSKNKK